MAIIASISYPELIAILLSHVGCMLFGAAVVGYLINGWRLRSDGYILLAIVGLSVILNSSYLYIRNCHGYCRVIISLIYIVNLCWSCFWLFVFCMDEIFREYSLSVLTWIAPLYLILQLSLIYLFDRKDGIRKEPTKSMDSEQVVWNEKTMMIKFIKFTNGCLIIECIKDELQTTSNISDHDFLSFYGLCRQIMRGDNNTPKPSWIAAGNRLKWKEWTKYKGMTKQQALVKWEELYNKYLRKYPNIFKKYTNSDINDYDPFKPFIEANNNHLNDELSARMNVMSEEMICLKNKNKEIQQKYDNLRVNYTNITQEDICLKNQNKEIQQKYDDLRVNYTNITEEHKQLEMNFEELQLIYNERLSKSEYDTWNTRDVADWIVSLDKSRYNKYYDILLKNMQNEGINGHCLGDLEKNDLHRLGMTQFTDKRDVYNAIQQLIENRHEGLNDTAYLYK